MKKLIEIKGITRLSKAKRKEIKAGGIFCTNDFVCLPQYCCINKRCYPCGLV